MARLRKRDNDKYKIERNVTNKGLLQFTRKADGGSTIEYTVRGYINSSYPMLVPIVKTTI
jgi:hypothetical protein